MMKCHELQPLPAWMEAETDLERWERQNLRNVNENSTIYRNCQRNHAALVEWIRALE
jgi:hypothetical protein